MEKQIFMDTAFLISVIDNIIIQQ